MFSPDADLFFQNPRIAPVFPNRFGVLYLLRRDIDQCMGLDPNTGGRTNCQALWPGAMAILAGIDLLAKFYAGGRGGVGSLFRRFLGRFCPSISVDDRQTIYQLRNALLHSFGLYSEDKKGRIYRFLLTADGTGALVVHNPPDQYRVDLRVLHRAFENAVASYAVALDAESSLQANFNAMFGNYGRVHIG